MPPQTTAEHIREKQIASRVAEMALPQVQGASQSGGSPRLGPQMYIPGGSMHEVLYTNGDNAPTPDRVVVPKQGCGSTYTHEQLSADHDGSVPSNPFRARTDNYGNRWLEGGFEYPPYEGRLTSTDQTSDDIPADSHSAEVTSGPNLGPNGDEPSAHNVLPEATGATMTYDGPDVGARTTSGHAGSRSDKWPASGLTNFKHPQG